MGLLRPNRTLLNPDRATTAFGTAKGTILRETYSHIDPPCIYSLKTLGFLKVWYSTHFRMQTANQDIPVEVRFSCREYYQNGTICGDEALGKISVSKCV